jgi:hypothetical protein
MPAPFGPFGLGAGKTFVGGAGAGCVVDGAVDGTVLAPDDAVRVCVCGFSTTRIGSRSAGSDASAGLDDWLGEPRSADTEIRVLASGAVVFAAAAGLVRLG